MKKIITAIGNPILNNELKKEKDIQVINSDIKYKEAIIEILQKNKDIDIIVISEKILGDIENKYLIEKIKEINNKINIIYVLEKENTDLEKILKEKNINDIYYNNKTKLNELINIIKNKEIYNEEEIKKEIEMLKNIILNNNTVNIENNVINTKINNDKNKVDKNVNNKSKINKANKLMKKFFYKNNFEDTNKIISIIGEAGIGKSTICSSLAYLSKNKKVLIIDSDYLNQDIHTIFGTKIYSKKIQNNQYNLENYIIQLNNTINLFTITEENKKYIENDIEQILKNLKEKYNLIFIDINLNNKWSFNKKILEISDKIILLIELNLISIKKSKNLICNYLNNYNINNNKINIIINKFRKFNIELQILKNIFNEFQIIGKIKFNNEYNNLINKNFKTNIIDKKIKEDFNKIIKNI